MRSLIPCTLILTPCLAFTWPAFFTRLAFPCPERPVILEYRLLTPTLLR